MKVTALRRYINDNDVASMGIFLKWFIHGELRNDMDGKKIKEKVKHEA